MPLASSFRVVEDKTKDRASPVSVTTWGGSASAGGMGICAVAFAGGGASFEIELVVMSENFALRASAACRVAIADALLSSRAVAKLRSREVGTNAGRGV